MSSLFDKLKTLLGASARGPRRYKKEPAPSAKAERDQGPVPEVVEAPARRQKMPEVVEAPLAESVQTLTQAPASSTDQPVIRVRERAEDQPETLEEGRVADLLKDQE
jgi:hypothetical protein